MRRRSESVFAVPPGAGQGDPRGQKTRAALQRLQPQRGSAAVEFALIVIVLMTMVLGIMDFGRALYAYHFVSHAAKTAARWAAVNGDACTNDGSCTAPVSCSSGGCTTCTAGCLSAQSGDIQNYVMMITPPGINTSVLNTTATWTTDANSPSVCTQAVGGIGPYDNYPGCTVQVQVSYQFTFLFPLVSNKTLTLSSTSEMVIAH
jgi:Flp pilus assembly protein TadG